jgi:hypothetical protein
MGNCFQCKMIAKMREGQIMPPPPPRSLHGASPGVLDDGSESLWPIIDVCVRGRQEMDQQGLLWCFFFVCTGGKRVDYSTDEFLDKVHGAPRMFSSDQGTRLVPCRVQAGPKIGTIYSTGNSDHMGGMARMGTH